MKILFFLLLATVTTSHITAQGNVMFYSRDSVFYVFGNQVNIREEASAEAAVLTRLNAGDKVQLLEVTADSHVVKGMKYPWVHIAYTQEGITRQGYIWGGMLSVMHRHIPGSNGKNLTLMTGPKEFRKKGEFKKLYGEVRLYSDTSLLSKTEIIFPDWNEAGYFGMGVDDDDDTLSPSPYGSHVFRCNMNYEMCGPVGELNILVKDHKIIFAGTDDGTVDGGFSAGNYYIFPWETEGEKDKIIRKYEMREMSWDDNGNESTLSAEDKVLEVWAWKNGQFVKLR